VSPGVGGAARGGTRGQYLRRIPPPRAPRPPRAAAEESERPWTRNRTLGDEAFKDEVRAWGASEVIFSPALWPVYLPVLRSDYSMFDEYAFEGLPGRPGTPIVAQWAGDDARITRDLVAGWEGLSAPGFALERLPGPHMFPLDRDLKRGWLEGVVGHLSGHL